jgi:hypothetical protein
MAYNLDICDIWIWEGIQKPSKNGDTISQLFGNGKIRIFDGLMVTDRIMGEKTKGLT